MEPYTFPSFDQDDLAFGKLDFKEHMNSDTPYYDKSFPELRAIMENGGNTEQYSAAKTLLQGGDQKTILRVVYSLKQGNPTAEHLLKEFPSRQIIPYLMEDVAHGNMEDYSDNWVNIIDGKVRLASTEIVARVLSSIKEFPEPAREWLKYVSLGNSSTASNNLSEKSMFLVEWWMLNEKAFVEERWDEVIPVPHAGTYSPPPKPDLSPAGAGGFDPTSEEETPEPWKFTPLDVPESFEDWSARIVNPEKRDLRWVPLTFENNKWVEHPPIHLDPLAPSSVQARHVRRPVAPSVLVKHDASSQWPVWIVSLGVVASLLFLLFRLRRPRRP